MFRITLLLLTLLAPTLQSQITVTVIPVVEIAPDSKQFGNFIEVPSTFNGKPFSLAHIVVNTELPIESLQITVVDDSHKNVPFSTIVGTPPNFTVVQPGHIYFEVFGIDFEKKLFIYAKQDFTVGPSKPQPGPDPGPIPPDVFNNIGQRVATWVTGLPNRPQISKAYKDAADLLRNDPSQTVNSASMFLGIQLKAVPQYELYTSYAKQLNADLSSRWPLTKGVLADYYTAVAAGLDGAK